MTKLLGKKISAVHIVVGCLFVIIALLLIQLGYGNLAKTIVTGPFANPTPWFSTPTPTLDPRVIDYAEVIDMYNKQRSQSP